MYFMDNGCDHLDWRKASSSMNGGNCVEVATASKIVVIRDSMDRLGRVLPYPDGSWRTFVEQAKTGRFDSF